MTGPLRSRLRIARCASLLVALALLASCGGDKNPNSPSGQDPTPSAGALSITSLTANGRGAPGDATYRVTLRLEETGGREVTLTSIVFEFDGGRRATIQGDGRRVGASSSLSIPNITITDPSQQGISRTINATVNYTDASRTGTATRSADVTVIVMVTLSGTVRDRATNAPIAGATLRVQSGESEGVSTTSDSSGHYALLPIVAGSFRVFVSASGYDGQSYPIAIDRDTPFDATLARTPPAVEYTITGSARTCDVTYRNGTGGTDQREVRIPWSYSWNGARSGDFLYVSCQIDQSNDNGSIFVSVYKNGGLIKSASATGFPHIATASGSY
jgi:hypothetical protein